MVVGRIHFLAVVEPVVIQAKGKALPLLLEPHLKGSPD